jgi:cell division protease FtsH
MSYDEVYLGLIQLLDVVPTYPGASPVLLLQVSVCPCNLITGYTLFLEDEAKTVDCIVTRSDLESHIVVNLAGYCAEKLVMGEEHTTALGAADSFHANMIAREMIMSMGMGRRMGPVDLMHVNAAAENLGSSMQEPDMKAPDDEYYYHATDMSTEQVRVQLVCVFDI